MAESAPTVAPCSQCGKPGIGTIAGAPLCVDCLYKFQVARTLEFRLAAIGLNHAAAEMDYISGLPPMTPRMQVPDIPRSPIILNNIKVDNSVVGSINTGNVQSIDVSITYLKQAGDKRVGAALQTLAETVANATAIPATKKDQLLDQVAYLSEQAVAPAKDRRPGMIQAALTGITLGASAVAAVAKAWETAEPIIRSHFGF